MLEALTEGEIGQELFLRTQTVAHHFRRIFRRLDLPGDPTDDRRVQGVVVVAGPCGPEATGGPGVVTCPVVLGDRNLAGGALGQALKHRSRTLLLTGEGADDDQRAGERRHGPLQDRKLLLCGRDLPWCRGRRCSAVRHGDGLVSGDPSAENS